MAPHRHADELREGIHFRGQVQDGAGVHVLAAGHRKAHAEEDHAELGALHPIDEVLQPLDRQTRFRDGRAIDRLALDERAQGGRDLEVLAGPDLQKDVRGLGTWCFANVHQDHRAALAALRHELALLHDRVPGEMARMAFRRIAAPVHDEVRPFLDFAEGARNLATQLGGYLSGAVSKRCVAVDHTSISSASATLRAGPRT